VPCSPTHEQSRDREGAVSLDPLEAPVSPPRPTLNALAPPHPTRYAPPLRSYTSRIQMPDVKKVFISYAHEDGNPAHAQKVHGLADSLNRGLDCRMDHLFTGLRSRAGRFGWKRRSNGLIPC